MPKYDLVMLSCGRPELTERCIGSVVEHSQDFRLIWIDNSPETSGAELIAGKFNLWSSDHFEYLPMPENLGFVKGTNVGLAMATAPFVVLLNNDTEVPAGWLQTLERGFEVFPDAGAVGPLTNSPRGWQFEGNFKHNTRDYIEINQRTGVVGPMLAFFCTMIPRAAIERVGYISEEFSPGFGDDDSWCAEARKNKFKIVLATKLVVKHVHRATWPSEQVKALQARNTERLLKRYGVQR